MATVKKKKIEVECEVVFADGWCGDDCTHLHYLDSSGYWHCDIYGEIEEHYDFTANDYHPSRCEKCISDFGIDNVEK